MGAQIKSKISKDVLTAKDQYVQVLLQFSHCYLYEVQNSKFVSYRPAYAYVV